MNFVFVGIDKVLIDLLPPGVCAVAHPDAWSVISSSHPEILIIDCREAAEGFHLCQKIRSNEWAGEPYLLLLLDSSNQISDAMRSACDDFLVAPFDKAQILGKLSCAQRHVSHRMEFSHKARHDPLTGIYNRAGVLEVLERELYRSKRESTFVSILLCDLDNFKNINDSFGHSTGDAVIRKFVETIIPQLRPYDHFGRLGGDEFLLVLPNCEPSAALTVADRLRVCIEETPLVQDSQTFSFTVSIGVAATTAYQASVEILLALSDSAMYLAKASGRNCAKIAPSCQQDEIQPRAEEILENLKKEKEDRRKTQEALKKIEDRLQLISKSTNDALWEWNSVTGETWWSEGALGLFGYTSDELEKNSGWWWEKIHPEDYQRLKKSIQSAIAARKDFLTEEYRFRRKNGEYAEVLDRTQIIYAPSGERLGMVGALIDVTERNRTRRELLAAQSQYRLLVEQLPVAVYKADFELHRRWRYVSPQIQEMLGFSAQQLTEDTQLWFRQLHPADRERVVAEQALSEGSGAPFKSEYRMQTADGKTMWLRDEALLVSNQEKDCRCFQGIISDITKRKQIEEEIIESELRIRSFVGSIDEIVFEFDREATYINIWTNNESLLLRPRSELIGKRVGDFFPDEFTSEFTARIQRVLNSGNAETVEYPLEVIGGKRWFQARISPVRSKDDSSKTVCVLSRDITELKRAHLLERSLYLIAENAVSAKNVKEFYSAIHDIISGLMYAENFYVALYDDKADRIEFVYFADTKDQFLGSAYGSRGATAYVIRTGKPLLVSEAGYRELIEKGEIELVGSMPVYWLGVPLIIEGRTIGALVVQTYRENISLGEKEKDLLIFVSQHVASAIARKKAEEALRQSEEKFRSLFEESKDAIFISTPEGKFLDINQAGLELFGYSSKEELLDVDIAQKLYSDPKDRDRYHQAISEKGYVKDFELTLKKKNGEKIFVLETATSVRDNKGDVIVYRGITRDITKLKRLENQLLEANKLETVGRLAAGIAHDFNNVLMAISGYCDVIEFGGDPFASVKEVKRATAQGAALTRQLLAFSRKQMCVPRIFSLNDVLRKMQMMIERLIMENIRLTMDFDSSLPCIKADAGHVEQIVMNLVVNARDAMPQGGMLNIRTRRVRFDGTQDTMDLPAGDCVRLSFIDSGVGMDEQTRAKIFEPFFTTKGVGHGTGLGLSTVYGIVKQNGGWIDVHSQPGKGTVFDIYFPVCIEQTTELVDGEKPAQTISTGGREVILLVDDNEPARISIKVSLEMHGYKVLEAQNGKEALTIADHHEGTIDVLLTDVIMPLMGGVELASCLKKQRPGLKVIFLSGYSDKARMMNSSNVSQGTAFLQKPASIESLAATIRQLLSPEA